MTNNRIDSFNGILLCIFSLPFSLSMLMLLFLHSHLQFLYLITSLCCPFTLYHAWCYASASLLPPWISCSLHFFNFIITLMSLSFYYVAYWNSRCLYVAAFVLWTSFRIVRYWRPLSPLTFYFPTCQLLSFFVSISSNSYPFIIYLIIYNCLN